MVKSTDMGFIDNLLNAIRNKYLNATGAERDLLTLIKDKDITQAQTLMQNRDTEVLQAIQEYNPNSTVLCERPIRCGKARSLIVPRSCLVHDRSTSMRWNYSFCSGIRYDGRR